MSSGEREGFVVDRVEGRKAVVVSERTGGRFDVELGALPKGAGEGSCLSAELGSEGHPVWSTAVLDEARRRELLREAEQTIRDLRARDPGGDITL